MTRIATPLIALLAAASAIAQNNAERPFVSGIYPHLAYYNNEGECGTGAVVPWADRLWLVTYAPHAPTGSSDKLYEITPELEIVTRPESIGGTPANRMIHRESNQLFIGPYAVDAERNVRVIPHAQMLGRPTGNARHLTDPAGKIYYATMEEGFYEVDVASLTVTTLYADTHSKQGGPRAGLPGYHGKGLYSGQGKLIYANNGETGGEALKKPFVPSGVLAQWDGSDWEVVRRNQFTEVTGPGGIYGSAQPESDPIWSVGWDHKSLLLMMLDGGRWHTFRLPKASHSYDGAHGWNTEWPRIREIGGGGDLLMTMHGMFWKFPKAFAAGRTAGIAPRSSYLKVIGDFCRWGDYVVLGCDDSAKNEFTNKRRAKGEIAGPQSHSNLWFLKPEQLDAIGPAIGRGSVWLKEDIAAGTASDPFLFAGFDRRGVHLTHAGEAPARFEFEVDAGDGVWKPLRAVEVPAQGYAWVSFGESERGAWVRVKSDAPLSKATAAFQYANRDGRAADPDPIFAGLAKVGDAAVTGGIVRARGENKRSLHFAALGPGGDDLGYYVLDGDFKLVREDDPTSQAWLKKNAAIPAGVLIHEASSILFVSDAGERFRLPKGDPAFAKDGPLGPERVDREVCTERDLFSAGGTFFELPADNAGGFARARPVATHSYRIKDYCSYRGLFVMSGIAAGAPADNPHVIRSTDGKTALWVGAIDDVWKMGKPRGEGGPWLDSKVSAGQASDPYLMTGYDEKTLTLSHGSTKTINVTIEVDLTGEGGGHWVEYQTLPVAPGEAKQHRFPDGFSAYWVRFKADADAVASAQLTYR